MMWIKTFAALAAAVLPACALAQAFPSKPKDLLDYARAKPGKLSYGSTAERATLERVGLLAK